MSRDRERGSRVFIGRLPHRADKRDIEKFFKGYGRIQDIHLKLGYAFIVSVFNCLYKICV
jgi:RNA recognition motif-containing protein